MSHEPRTGVGARFHQDLKGNSPALASPYALYHATAVVADQARCNCRALNCWCIFVSLKELYPGVLTNGLQTALAVLLVEQNSPCAFH